MCHAELANPPPHRPGTTTTTTTPTPASASQRLPHTSLIAMQSDQLSGNEACTALLWRSVQGYRRDSCEPQATLMATNLVPLQTH